MTTIEKKYERIITNLKKYFADNHFKHAVIGLSGGIDSSLTLKLAVDALGAENVTGILMPEIGLTKEENIIHAEGLAEYFGVKTHTAPINKALIPFNNLPWRPSELATQQSKARVRMVILYNFANTHAGTLVLGTSNKTECLLGYGTKFGDAASDLYVIGDLYKTEVWDMARYLSLPDEIINKTPSAELAPGQTDEEDLGGSYLVFDKILQKAEAECGDFSDKDKMDECIEALIEKGMDPLLVRKAFQLIKANLHKGKMPEVL